MSLLDLITKSRSIRRFDETLRLTNTQLRALVNLARLSPSAANKQRLRYRLISDPFTCADLFPQLAWAGYLTDWDGPKEGERPVAYIVVLNDLSIDGKLWCDDGIAIQSILIGAAEQGLGGCILGAIKRVNLANILNIDTDRYEILYVLALGVPAEEAVIDPVENNDIRYWRDADGKHHVPKRSLDELII